jgi:uncharacterized protein (DUF433 family)
MNKESFFDRIEMNPQILGGKPVIAGTRIPIELILDFLAHSWNPQKLLAEYPNLRQEDIQAAIAYASQRVQHEEIYPVPLSKELQRAR